MMTAKTRRMDFILRGKKPTAGRGASLLVECRREATTWGKGLREGLAVENVGDLVLPEESQEEV